MTPHKAEFSIPEHAKMRGFQKKAGDFSGFSEILKEEWVL
jgi:hypothetical protein